MVTNCNFIAPGADTSGIGNDPSCGSYYCAPSDECFRYPQSCYEEVGATILPLLDPVEITTFAGTTDDGGCPGWLPGCIRSLRPTDRALVGRFRAFMRTIFNNSAEEALCGTLADKIDLLLPALRMGVNMPSVENHGAQTSGGVTHIDRNLFDDALSDPSKEKTVITALFHEAAHHLYPPHPSSEVHPYTTHPYSRLNFNPTNGCVAWD